MPPKTDPFEMYLGQRVRVALRTLPARVVQGTLHEVHQYDVVVQRRGSGEVLIIPKAAIAYCAPGRESAER